MFLFYRLLFAHIIADFPLQTSQIFKIKMNTQWGVILHTLIVLIFSILFAFPYLENPKVIAVLLIIFLSHTVIDKLKLEYFKKTNTHRLKIFIIDQVLHISIIAILAFNFPEKILLTSPFNNVFLSNLIHLYNNDILYIKFTGLVLSIYFIPILIMFVKEKRSSYNKQSTNQKTNNINISVNTNIDRFYRLSLTLFAQYLASRYLILIFILFIVISIILYKLKPDKIKKIYNLTNTINSSLALFIGILLKFI